MKKITVLSLTTINCHRRTCLCRRLFGLAIQTCDGHAPYGTLTVRFYYAIQEKNGKTEYDYQPPQPDTCVNSLFPHAGYTPCWYERKYPEKAIRI